MSRSMWIKAGLTVLGISVIPASYALAEGNASTDAKVEKVAKKKEAHFPMEGAKFVKRVEKRTQKGKAKLIEKMEERGMTAEQQKAVLADFEAGRAKVRAAAEAAAKDGTVTQEEADQVHAIAKQQRKALRQKYHLGKGKKGKPA